MRGGGAVGRRSAVCLIENKELKEMKHLVLGKTYMVFLEDLFLSTITQYIFM